MSDEMLTCGYAGGHMRANDLTGLSLKGVDNDLMAILWDRGPSYRMLLNLNAA